MGLTTTILNRPVLGWKLAGYDQNTGVFMHLLLVLQQVTVARPPRQPAPTDNPGGRMHTGNGERTQWFA